MDRHVFAYEPKPDLSGVLMLARRFIAGEGERLLFISFTSLIDGLHVSIPPSLWSMKA